MRTLSKSSLASAVGLLLLAAYRPAHAAVEYIHTDSLGTPVAITDSDGNVIQTSEYEPFGKLLNRTLTDAPGYTGHETDATTGMIYAEQRYYDPQVGRFLSVDPVTPDSGGDFNRYDYAANNPYMFKDPDGRQEEPQPNQKEATDRQEERRKLSDSRSIAKTTTGQIAFMQGASALGSGPAPSGDHSGGTLNYNQRSGEIDDGNRVLGVGYAGHGPGVNDPALQAEQGVGPLPQGLYRIGRQQTNVTKSGTKLLSSMRLIPDPSNKMFGRGGFLIHGDNSRHDQSASEGCVVQSPVVRNEIANGGFSFLNVFAPRPEIIPIW